MLEEKIKRILQSECNYFLNNPNIIGIGFGYKRKNNFYTCQECLQVFVKNKICKCKLNPNVLIPSTYKGIQTDIIESGEINTRSLIERKRPSIGGYCISSINYDAYGSICCLVSNGVSNFLLSTNHVIAGENEFITRTPITQPAFDYGGKHPADTIATLYRYIPLRFIEGTSQPINYSDCALGLLTNPSILSPEIAFIGSLKGVKKTPKLNEQVKKVGCISELTTGTVQSIHGVTSVGLPSGRRALFHDLIFTTYMIADGDSGCILVNKGNYALGMGFAGTNNMSVYCHLNTVLDQLGVHLVT